MNMSEAHTKYDRIPNICHVSVWWFRLLINPHVTVTCRHRFLQTFNTHPRNHPSPPDSEHSPIDPFSLHQCRTERKSNCVSKWNKVLLWREEGCPTDTGVMTLAASPFAPTPALPLQSPLGHTLLRRIQTGSGAQAASQRVPELKRSGRQGDDTSY
jgi:hypothetical protein